MFYGAHTAYQTGHRRPARADPPGAASEELSLVAPVDVVAALGVHVDPGPLQVVLPAPHLPEAVVLHLRQHQLVPVLRDLLAAAAVLISHQVLHALDQAQLQLVAEPRPRPAEQTAHAAPELGEPHPPGTVLVRDPVLPRRVDVPHPASTRAWTARSPRPRRSRGGRGRRARRPGTRRGRRRSPRRRRP